RLSKAFYLRKQRLEVVLKEMLHNARGNRGSHVNVVTTTPASRKIPDLVWIALDELGNFDDGLPTGVQLSIGRCAPGKRVLRSGDGFDERHVSPNAAVDRRRDGLCALALYA